MMKMATGEGSPLRQGAGTGSRLVFGGYRALRRRNSRSIVFSDVFRVYGYIYIGEGSRSREPQGAHEGRERALDPRGHLVASQTSTPSLLDCVCSKNNSPEGLIPFGLCLIFLVFEILKRAIKQQYGLGLRLVG